MRSPYLTYRPLRAGIAILNSGVDQYGTLGFVGMSADGQTWIVSCYHVLGRIDFSSFFAGERIFQPDAQVAADPIAEMVAGRGNTVLDCAAARVLPGVIVANEILGLGAIAPQLALAKVGMRVCKFGVATELTEGVVTAIDGPNVIIRPPSSFSEDYRLSAIGDSGALWVEQGSNRPVALHKQGAVGGVEQAIGTSIADVLAALDLQLPS